PHDTFGEPAREIPDQAAHALDVRHEEAVAGAGIVRPRRRAQPEDEAPVASLELDEAGHGGAQRQPLGVAGVDAAEERLGHALERLAAEPPADEGRDALVGVVRAARQPEVEEHAQLAAPREERRGGDRPGVGRGEEHEALRHRDQLAAAHDVRAPVAGPRADQPVAEAEPLAEGERPGLLRDEGVGAALDQEAVGPLARDRAAEPILRLEQQDLDSAAGLDQAERGREPGHAATHDRDPLHRAASRTTSASMRMKSGWSFTAGARTKPRPAA